jgi:hypothetical protein
MLMDDFYGDKFRWFAGIVKDIGDDRTRVRVRIFGIHHTDDIEKVSDGDLPWALVLYPTTGGQTIAGNSSHNLMPGSWVVGFFSDGIDSQQPIVIGSINGGMGSIDSTPKQYSNVDPLSPSQSSSTPSSNINDSIGNPTTTQLIGDSNVQKVYNYFWENIKQEGKFTGDLKCVVSAICGNLQGESGIIDAQTYDNSQGETTYGIARWKGGKYDRYTPLLRFCGITAKVSSPNLPPLEKQLDYMWHELHTSERSAYNKLINSTNVQDAAAGMIYFERDSSYKKINGAWIVDRKSSSYITKLGNARKLLSTLSFTGTASS